MIGVICGLLRSVEFLAIGDGRDIEKTLETFGELITVGKAGQVSDFVNGFIRQKQQTLRFVHAPSQHIALW